MEETVNKRIARNTLFLYLRLALATGISLYTSRVILQALGVTDYGLYGVVGGIVILFAIGIALLPLVLLVFMGAGSDSEDDDDIIPSGTIGMGKPTKAYLTWKVMNDILGDDE